MPAPINVTVKWPGKLWPAKGDIPEKVSATMEADGEEYRVNARPGTDKADALLALRKGQDAVIFQAGTYEGHAYYDILGGPAPTGNGAKKPGLKEYATVMSVAYWEMQSALTAHAPQGVGAEEFPSSDQSAKLAVALFIQYCRDHL